MLLLIYYLTIIISCIPFSVYSIEKTPLDSTINLISIPKKTTQQHDCNKFNEENELLNIATIKDDTTLDGGNKKDDTLLDASNEKDDTLLDISDVQNNVDTQRSTVTIQDMLEKYSSLISLDGYSPNNQNIENNPVMPNYSSSSTETNYILEISINHDDKRSATIKDNNISNEEYISEHLSNAGKSNNQLDILNTEEELQSTSYIQMSNNEINNYLHIYPELETIVINGLKLSEILYTKDIEHHILFIILDLESSNENFIFTKKNNPKTKILIFFFILCTGGTSNLILADGSSINIAVVMSMLYFVPLYTQLVFFAFDNCVLFINQGVKTIVKQILNNKLQAGYNVITALSSVYLAYLSSLIETYYTGKSYQLIASYVTTNQRTLSIAYNVGYIAKLTTVLVIYTSFFYDFLQTIAFKSGIGYLLNLHPTPTTNLTAFNVKKNFNEMISMIDKNDRFLSLKKISSYINNHNLNSVLHIADIQKFIIKEPYNNKCNNLSLNIAELMFIGVATLFCGLAFKQIFSAKLILQDFIDQIGEQHNDSILLHLKNRQQITCKDYNDCINNIDFSEIYLAKNQIIKLLNTEKKIIISCILNGISMASYTTLLVINTIYHFKNITKGNITKRIISKVYLTKKNIFYYFSCLSIMPPMWFYVKNILSVEPIAEKNNKLLSSIGQVSLLTTQNAMFIIISFFIIAGASSMLFIANAPKTINYFAKKIISCCCKLTYVFKK